jgi:hypothetical protein
MPQGDEVNALKASVDELDARVSGMKTVEANVPPRIVLLAELTKQLPQEVWVEYLYIQGTTLKLRVQGDPGLQIAGRVGQSPYFTDARLQANGNQLTIDATIRWPGEASGDERPAEAEEDPS